MNHSVGAGYGYQGTIEWDNSGYGYGMPERARGHIKLRKVWEGKDGEELFEGFWEVDVRYGSVLRRKGHGNGEKHNCSFWAIEKLARDEDEELVQAGDNS